MCTQDWIEEHLGWGKHTPPDELVFVMAAKWLNCNFRVLLADLSSWATANPFTKDSARTPWFDFVLLHTPLEGTQSTKFHFIPLLQPSEYKNFSRAYFYGFGVPPPLPPIKPTKEWKQQAARRRKKMMEKQKERDLKEKRRIKEAKERKKKSESERKRRERKEQRELKALLREQDKEARRRKAEEKQLKRDAAKKLKDELKESQKISRLKEKEAITKQKAAEKLAKKGRKRSAGEKPGGADEKRRKVEEANEAKQGQVVNLETSPSQADLPSSTPPLLSTLNLCRRVPRTVRRVLFTDKLR